MLSDLRAFVIESTMLMGTYRPSTDIDYGREQILPFLKMQNIFANTNYSFGYDVINGGNIQSNHVKIYAVQPNDRIVMASDRYPQLFDTLEETENYLKTALSEDPDCIYEIRGTKGLAKNNLSYDDGSYISFTVH